MKNQLIATIVAGLILFFWQFASWSAVLEYLGQTLEPGSYMIPQPAPGSSKADQDAFMAKYATSPWASVSYHASLDMNMGMNMVRGLVVDLLAAFLLVWLLSQFANLTFKSALLGSLAVGAVAYLTIPYLWWQHDGLHHRPGGSMGHCWRLAGLVDDEEVKRSV
jgi:hypothetical protein